MCRGGRRVSITWDRGEVSGDPELAESLRALDGSGEVVGIRGDGGKSHVVEASLSRRDLALDTICYWIGHVTALHGDLGGANPDDFID